MKSSTGIPTNVYERDEIIISGKIPILHHFCCWMNCILRSLARCLILDEERSLYLHFQSIENVYMSMQTADFLLRDQLDLPSQFAFFVVPSSSGAELVILVVVVLVGQASHLFASAVSSWFTSPSS
jgi:hypothetical protein